MGNYYGAGDNYGVGTNYAYQAGGIFGDIGKFIGGVARTVTGVAAKIGIPGAGIAKGAVNLIAPPPRPMIAPPGFAPIIPPIIPTPGIIGAGQRLIGGGEPGYEVQQPVGTFTPQGFLQMCGLKGTRPNKSGYYRQIVKGNPTQVIYIPKGSVCVKSRRLNVANPRALRKAIRRAQGFSKLARRVMTFVSAKAPKGRARFKRAR